MRLQNADKVVRKVWAHHIETLLPETYESILNGEKPAIALGDQRSHGSPLDVSSSLEIVIQAITLTKLLLELYEVLVNRLGRKPTTDELNASAQADVRAQQCSEPVKRRIPEAVRVLIEIIE
jgi:hypothetical protein